MQSITSTTTLSARVQARLDPRASRVARVARRGRLPKTVPSRLRRRQIALVSSPRLRSQAPTRPKSARSTSVVPNATRDSKKAAAAEEESSFWKKVFLKDGQEEVSSADYQKFQKELNEKKAAAKARNADKGKFDGCVVM
jgi:hypothetical protein